MNGNLKETFSGLWEKYFDGAEFPIAFYYTDQGDEVEMVKPPSGRQCIMAVLFKVQKGTSLCFEANSIGCPGGKRSLGYSKDVMPNFEYFLSCGIPGKLEGERYKKSPELVKEMVKRTPRFQAPKRFIRFKRWDKLGEKDNPEVVIFFASPDVLAGLFTLANFDSIDGNRVIAPMSSGCGSIVMYPYLEKNYNYPRCILGMFDPSARPYVHEETLTFAVSMNRFTQMIENLPESFLVTPTWKIVKTRLERNKGIIS